nr:integrase, catalytic region, zinc finger, CCHC-type, peptidase aspartic, catalytic [Tanacetum cinerariifolium]
MISLGQKNSLAEYMILYGAENRPPMLDKDLTYGRKCTQPKLQRNAAWYKEKAMLAEAQEAGQILDEEQLTFLTDLGIPAGQAQTIIPHNAAFQIEDLDTYDSDCNDLSNAQAILMANISNYGSDVISEVPNSETYLNDMDNQSVTTDDFGKRFTPQQELSAEQAFWLRIFNPTIEYSLPPVKVEVPSELPKKRTTPNALTEEYFEKNDLKAQLKGKDTTICKLKDTIKSLRKNKKEKIFDHDRCDLATINAELENSVAKLQTENKRLCKEINHVKPVFKDQFDSIKQTRVLQKELCDSLINNLNLKSAEHKDLKAQIQDKEQADILRGIVKQDKAQQPLDNALDFACKHAKRIQELLVYVRDTCPKELDLETYDSNKPMLNSTRVKCSTSASGSKPSGNTKNNRISQPSSSNKINKAEDQPRSVKTRKNNKNRVKKVKCDDHVMQSSSNANYVSVSINNAPVTNSVNDVKFGCLCAICGKCMIAETHYECVQLVVQIVLWYLDLGCSKHMTVNRSQLMNFVSKFSGTVRFENDQIARIMRYGDYQLGNVVISRDSFQTLFLKKPCIPPNRDEWDRLFQPMFDEYFNPPTNDVSPVQEATAARAEVVADSLVSISISQDAPSTSIPSSQAQEHSLIVM